MVCVTDNQSAELKHTALLTEHTEHSKLHPALTSATDGEQQRTFLLNLCIEHQRQAKLKQMLGCVLSLSALHTRVDTVSLLLPNTGADDVRAAPERLTGAEFDSGRSGSGLRLT